MKAPRKVIEFVENMTSNANEFQNDRAIIPTRGVHKVTTQDGFLAQHKHLTRQVEKLTKQVTDLP